MKSTPSVRPPEARTAAALALTAAMLAGPALTASALVPSMLHAAETTAVQNGKIAFTSLRNGNFDIYVINADGSDEQRLTDSPGIDDDAAFSPDGTKIAFTSDREGSDDVWVMNADGSDPVNLTANGSIFDAYPAWSPDGTEIAFSSTRDSDRSEIHVMNADGSDVRRLTFNDVNDRFPAFSPDGTTIAFESTRFNTANPLIPNTDIYTIDAADGGNERRVTADLGFDGGPAFSPDGATVAFSGRTAPPAEDPEIFVVGVDGSNRVNLTQLSGSDDHPSFSPDGSKIAYARIDGFSADIFVMDADGTNSTRLTTASGLNTRPSWGLAVEVDDTNAPEITAPEGVNAVATSITGAVVTFEVTAVDDVDGTAVVTCEPESGQAFPVGTTTVECISTDTAGNTATATFTVTVTVPGGAAGFTLLMDSIAALGLPTGVTRSLLGPLSQSARLLSDANPANDVAACNQLAAFVRIVADRAAGGTLAEDTADLLTSYATALAAATDCR